MGPKLPERDKKLFGFAGREHRGRFVENQNSRATQ